MSDLSALPLHPAAAGAHLPPYVTAPGQTDGLMIFSGIFLLVAVIGVGIFYFKLHALPEQLAHKGQQVQFQIVAVLALIALFTHNHAFWIAGLLLALVPMPDLTSPLRSMAGSLERMAGEGARGEGLGASAGEFSSSLAPHHSPLAPHPPEPTPAPDTASPTPAAEG